jgi:GT2 family glycosyltransferase
MPPISICVGFATCGRAAVLREAITQLGAQTRLPDQIFVCFTNDTDIEGISIDSNTRLIKSAPGLPTQRNIILDAAAGYDVILFLDDDFFVDSRYLETVSDVFSSAPDVAVATGSPYADGVRGPGFSPEQARAIIAAAGPQAIDPAFDAAPHAYGCNMAIRLATARDNHIRFDERLPLYGWSEDIDFSHLLGQFGRIVKLRGAQGVHLGVKSGRSPGRRLGYSQVANPLYLRAKGSYSWRRAAGSVGRNLVANLARAAFPEPYIDRRGRLAGNALALFDLCRGRMQPERVLDL